MLYMEIDLKKIANNILHINKVTNKFIIPVIKANAYNLGSLEVYNYLKRLDLDYVAVVDMDEALSLLENDKEGKILILNSLKNNELKLVNKYPNIAISINSLNDAISLNNVTLLSMVKVHIQVNTGMNRLGINDEEEYIKTLNLLKNNDKIFIEGLYTHFTGQSNYQNEVEIFNRYIKYYDYKMIHLEASSTYQESNNGNYVRVGLDIYGGSSSEGISQCIKVISKPVAINKIKKGDTIGYEKDYQATSDMVVAILPIGYSNGFLRSLRGYPVMANNKLYNSVGRVCMNHLFVEVDEEVTMDTEFIITSNEYRISKMAKYINTIEHEILCMFNINDKRYIK